MKLPYLLAIAIPTYKRTFEFTRLISQLALQIRRLSDEDQARITLSIYDNLSQNTSEKFRNFKSEFFANCQVSWIQNQTNIGPNLNINNAYSAGKDADYVWVIGDDEQLFDGAIANVISILKGHPSLGLLLLIDKDTYPLKTKLIRENLWLNYCDFAKCVASVQPNILIAHSLVSCNIVRSSVYDAEMALSEISKISPRWELPFCFPHMKGIVGGLSNNCSLSVMLNSNSVINASERSPASDKIDDEHRLMIKLYRMYGYWLIYEFGLSFELLLSDSSMNFLLPPSPCLSIAIVTRFIHNMRNIFGRIKAKFIGIFANKKHDVSSKKTRIVNHVT